MAMNMETVLKIKAQVTGDDQIKSLSGSMGKLDTNTKKTATSFGKLKTASSGLAGVLASLGLGAIASQFGQAAINSQRLQTRINTLAGPLGETGELLAFAADAAEKYGIGQNTATSAVADLYGRLRPTGIGLDQIKTAFLGVQNAAASVGLSAADTDGVLLQLSQALGSGTLQGDEFRSVMERLPAVGQALAESLGVSVGELKQLGADGKLTTDVVLQALDLLKEKEPPPPDAYKQFTAAVENLSIAFGEQLLPAFTPLVELATKALNIFSQLPGPVQTIVAAIAGIAGAAVILAPLVTALIALGPAITGLIGVVGPAIAGIVALLTGPVGIAVAIGAVLAAAYIFRDEIAGFFVSLGESVGGFIATLYDIFVQPFIDAFTAIYQFIAESWVGDLIEVVGGVITWFSETWNSIVDLLLFPFRYLIEVIKAEFIKPLIDFLTGARDDLGKSWNKVGEILFGPFKAALEFVNNNFVQPVLGAVSQVADKIKESWTGLIEPIQKPFKDALEFVDDKFVTPFTEAIKGAITFIQENWQTIQETLTAPFVAAGQAIQGVLNNVIGSIESTVNSVVRAINNLIRGANAIGSKVGLPSISEISKVSLPRLEFFAEGGYVNGPTLGMIGEGGQPEYVIPSSKADGFAANWMAGIRGPAAIPRFADGGFVAPSNANVSIQTGPVTQMNGANYVTTQEMSAAVQAGVKQTLDLIRRDGNTRASLGIA